MSRPEEPARKTPPPLVEPANTGASSPPGADLSYRLRQQAVLSDFGLYALRCETFDALLTRAAELCAAGMDTQFAKVLKHRPERNDLFVCAGVGWAAGVVGEAAVGADLASPAGYALHTGQAVISNHLENEERFRTPTLLAEHGVKRAINVIIRGYEGRPPFGVLEVDSPSEGQFDEADLAFMQGFANLLGVAIERNRAETERDDALTALYLERQRLSAIIDQLPSGVMVASAPSGALILHNDAAVRVLGHEMPSTANVADYRNFGGLRDDGRPYAAEDYPTARALNGASIDQEPMRYRRGDGRIADLVVSAAPVRDGAGQVVMAVSAFNDVSDVKGVEQALRKSLERQDMLTREMSHRVKNSLTQVVGLLGLQIRATRNTEVHGILEDTQARIRTIAEVHDQLWRGHDVQRVELATLLEDLCDSLRDTAPDHAIICAAAPVEISADQAIPIGLLVNELVTNALKYAYGEEGGEIWVSLTLHQDDDLLRIEVSDMGRGLPAGFDLAKSTPSLGMRLIATFAKQLGGEIKVPPCERGAHFVLDIPRDGPFSR